MVWRLYGNEYDLSNFIDKHPGGREVLLRTNNEGDLTVMFETYHAFSNKDQLRKHLDLYKIGSYDSSNDIAYDFSLYKKLVMQVKESALTALPAASDRRSENVDVP